MSINFEEISRTEWITMIWVREMIFFHGNWQRRTIAEAKFMGWMRFFYAPAEKSGFSYPNSNPFFFLLLLHHSLALVVSWASSPSIMVGSIEVHYHSGWLPPILSLWLSLWCVLWWQHRRRLVFYICEWSVYTIQVDNPYKPYQPV